MKPKNVGMSLMLRYFFCIFFVVSFIDSCLSLLIFSPESQEVEKYVNESYIVTCQSDSLNDTSLIYWTKGKNKRIGDKGYTYVSSVRVGKALFFQQISLEDNGVYECHTPEELKKFELIVVSPIMFVDTPKEQVVQENRPGIIKCKVKGDLKFVSITWKFEGKDISNNDKYKLIPDGLKIKNVSLENKGTYTCKAYRVSSKAYMIIEELIHLKVQHKPLHKKPVHAKVNQAYGYVGGLVNLTCEAIAEPAANFTWYRQHKKTMPGRIIEEAHWSILQLYIQNSSIFGDYLCKASNSLGTLDQIINLQEGVKPPAPQKFQLRSAGSDFLEFDINGPDLNHTKKDLNNIMSPTGYRIEYKIKKDDGKKASKKKEEFKKKKTIEGITEGWEDAYVVEFHDGVDENDQYPYILNNLVHNTLYEVRVGTRNIAGVSDYIGPQVYRTLRLHADSVTSGTMTSYPVIAESIVLIKCLPFVYTYLFAYFIG